MYEGCGPIFGYYNGCYTLYICNNCNTNSNSYSQLGYSDSCYETKGDDSGTFVGLSPSNNTVYFYVEDYEVYEVE